MTAQMLDPRLWTRSSQGLTATIPSFPGGILPSSIDKTMSSHFGPYTLLLVGVYTDDEGVPFEGRNVTVQEMDAFAAQGQWQFFISSDALTPGIEAAPDRYNLPLLATNGLINVQYGRTQKGQPQPAWLGCVNRVRNSVSGQVVHHAEYERIFRTLQRELLLASRGTR